ncbi:signal transduction histidine kinase [Bacillus oleivorans]|uniref:histidine kinase n=1 Tax=Bacillus oleivorans TaxID=1448271 RepID=A0A285CH23_9BACI|nr:HAMP domain-containing sensor histidine kinase [Bacillus oleivorans]SNX66897.1 signal transduction histidine kinase [Bacillus oleivorans]
MKRKVKFRHSLLSKYILIIGLGLTIFPLSFPFVSLLVFFPINEIETNENPYANHEDLEKMWHQTAQSLDEATDEEIDDSLMRIHKEYPKASVFWVNENNELMLQLPENPDLPQTWSANYSISFMKQSFGGDPFTVVAFIGETQDQGFIVFQVPREVMKTRLDTVQDQYDMIMSIGILTIFGAFIIFSWGFFYKIRKRLVRLEQAMHVNEEANELPDPVIIKKPDEIGALEQSFNEMIRKLEQSRERERKEEELRRHLIANLSHDLKTPLTAIRGYAYSLKKEELSDQGHDALQLLDQKISYMGSLIDNLLSYSLLTSGKYPYNPKKQDLVRSIKASLASWYPAFEKEGFTIHINIPDHIMLIDFDEHWLQRMLDNLFQNVILHAKTGKYISVSLIDLSPGFKLTIADQGRGMESMSAEKGVGVGLSIVSIMAKGLGWKWDIETSKNGTKMIFENSTNRLNENFV